MNKNCRMRETISKNHLEVFMEKAVGAIFEQGDRKSVV